MSNDTQNPFNYCFFSAPIGRLRLLCDGAALLAIEFEGQHSAGGRAQKDSVLQRACEQLHEYFCGKRQVFNLPLAAQGTAFQQQVWRALQNIPFGQLCSYSDIAERIGKPRAVRAVGAANGKNPIPIVVPCHRVIGSDGKLTGYAGGLKAKQKLLELEGLQLSL